MASSFRCAYVIQEVVLWLGILLKCASLEAGAGSQLDRGYEMGIKLNRYSNPNHATEENRGCDFFTTCDPQVKLWLDCKNCNYYHLRPREIYYPGNATSYDDQKSLAEHEIQRLPEMKFFYFNSQLPNITVHIQILDLDIWNHDLIMNRSLQIEPSDLVLKQKRVHSVFNNYGLNVELVHNVKCIRGLTCTADCIVPIGGALCENGMISCHNLQQPVPECQVVWGNFIFSFYLLSYNATESSTLEGSASCTRNNMTLLVHDRLTKREDETWSLVFSTTKGALGDVVEHDDTNYFDYYVRSQYIMFPNVSVSIQVWNNCSNTSETYTETWPAKLGKHYLKSPASYLQQFAGYFEISCQMGYSGLHCTDKRCLNCTNVRPRQCNGKGGPSCFYQLKCAQQCQNGATCIVKRESFDIHKASCMCAPGFNGSYCEIYNGTTCTEKTCSGRGNCTANFNNETKISTFKCSCEDGYTGLRCEVCVAPANITGCKSLFGNYALLVGLRSITNTNGLLLEGSHCDAGRSHCDTQVEACLEYECRTLLKAPNTNSFNSSHALQADFEYAYLEHNLSDILPHNKYYLKLSINEFDTENPYHLEIMLSPIIKIFEFNFQKETPITIDQSYADKQISFEYFMTLRCARGFTGIGCSTPCNASNSDDDLLAARNRIGSMNCSSCLFPRYMVCPDNSVGPSCAMKNLCANTRCGAGHQCTMAYNSAAVHCERVPDACERGLETCSRHGACHVNINNSTLDKQKAFCTCDEGFGGDFCAYGNWCINGSRTKVCNTQVECKDMNNKYYYCRCNDNSGFDKDNGSYCYTADPCERLRCHSDTPCKFDWNNNAFCACPSGFPALQGHCDDATTLGAWISILKTTILLSGVIFTISVLVAGWIYFAKKEKITKLKANVVQILNYLKNAVNIKLEDIERSVERTEKLEEKNSEYCALAPMLHLKTCTSKVIVQKSEIISSAEVK